jgi:hypothetical protein
MSTGDRYPATGLVFQSPQTSDGRLLLSASERAEVAALLRELASSAARASSRVKHDAGQRISIDQKLGILPDGSVPLSRLDEGQRQDLYACEHCSVLVNRARAMAERLEDQL